MSARSKGCSHRSSSAESDPDNSFSMLSCGPGIGGTRHVSQASQSRVALFGVSLTAQTEVGMSLKKAAYSLKFKHTVIAVAKDNGNHSAAAEFGVAS